MSKQPFYIGQEVEFLGFGKGRIYDNPTIKRGDRGNVLNMCFRKSWVVSNEKYWYVEFSACPGYWILYTNFAPIERTRINYVVKEVEVDAEIREKAKETILETTQTN